MTPWCTDLLEVQKLADDIDTSLRDQAKYGSCGTDALVSAIRVLAQNQMVLAARLNEALTKE